MPFPTMLTDRQYTAPSADDGGAITANPIAGDYSAWVTLLASAPSNGILTGITVRPTIDQYYAWNGSHWEVEIGIGAGPTVIATVRGRIGPNYRTAGSSDTHNYFPFPIAIEGILSGQAIKARMRQSATGDTSTWRVSATYVRTPLTGALESTANPLYNLPLTLGSVSIAVPGTAWANSSWATVEPGAGDRVVTGLVFYGEPQAEIDIGVGGTVRATIPVNRGYFLGFPYTVAIPPVRVTGELQVRLRSTNSGSFNFVALHCVDYPL